MSCINHKLYKYLKENIRIISIVFNVGSNKFQH